MPGQRLLRPPHSERVWPGSPDCKIAIYHSQYFHHSLLPFGTRAVLWTELMISLISSGPADNKSCSMLINVLHRHLLSSRKFSAKVCSPWSSNARNLSLEKLLPQWKHCLKAIATPFRSIEVTNSRPCLYTFRRVMSIKLKGKGPSASFEYWCVNSRTLLALIS